MAWWDFEVFPRRARAADAQVVIHPTNTGGGRRDQDRIVIMHDTMVLDHANMFDRGFRAYAKLAFPASIYCSSVVVTASKHSAATIKARWPSTRIEIIPWSVPGGGDRAVSLQAPLSSNVLIVSSLDKHKRIPMAIQAVAEVRAAQRTDLTLTIVHRRGNDAANVRESVLALDPRNEWITMTEGVDDATLQRLYREALCLLVSSIDEGFCLPALEATRHAVPVVHAFAGALPELAPRESTWLSADALSTLRLQLERVTDDVIWREWRDEAVAATADLTDDNFRNSWLEVVGQSERRL